MSDENPETNTAQSVIVDPPNPPIIDPVGTKRHPTENARSMNMPDGTPIGVVLARAHMMFHKYHTTDADMIGAPDIFADKPED